MLQNVTNAPCYCWGMICFFEFSTFGDLFALRKPKKMLFGHPATQRRFFGVILYEHKNDQNGLKTQYKC